MHNSHGFLYVKAGGGATSRHPSIPVTHRLMESMRKWKNKNKCVLLRAVLLAAPVRDEFRVKRREAVLQLTEALLCPARQSRQVRGTLLSGLIYFERDLGSFGRAGLWKTSSSLQFDRQYRHRRRLPTEKSAPFISCSSCLQMCSAKCMMSVISTAFLMGRGGARSCPSLQSRRVPRTAPNVVCFFSCSFQRRRAGPAQLLTTTWRYPLCTLQLE